jgi:hypothetical protein
VQPANNLRYRPLSGCRCSQPDYECHHKDRSAEVGFSYAHRRFWSERENVWFVHDVIPFLVLAFFDFSP